jgi:hypothetical protein
MAAKKAIAPGDSMKRWQEGARRNFWLAGRHATGGFELDR